MFLVSCNVWTAKCMISVPSIFLGLLGQNWNKGAMGPIQ
ncbi:hypothetical protein F383_13092 [Gossypium arboreum]|uniref:Uncharacterized protein n=1 Tax=Gossypium arboreum TaxID=29729 RepID=A0A0B0PN00_GOSAR|nr:hypothetical protein F383_13092 [Gossypium arboreum]